MGGEPIFAVNCSTVGYIMYGTNDLDGYALFNSDFAPCIPTSKSQSLTSKALFYKLQKHSSCNGEQFYKPDQYLGRNL
jgi:hypothetical protein